MFQSSLLVFGKCCCSFLASPFSQTLPHRACFSVLLPSQLSCFRVTSLTASRKSIVAFHQRQCWAFSSESWLFALSARLKSHDLPLWGLC